MNTDQATNDFLLLFTEVYRYLHQTWRKDEYRPSAEALAVLMHLSQSGPLTIAESAKHFERAQSSMSELVDNLEHYDLIERMKDARDKRRTLVWLTEQGRDVLKRSQQVLDPGMLRQVMQTLNEEQRRHLIEGLQALVDCCSKRKPEEQND